MVKLLFWVRVRIRVRVRVTVRIRARVSFRVRVRMSPVCMPLICALGVIQGQGKWLYSISIDHRHHYYKTSYQSATVV